jgi:hypothetical protein
MWLDALGLARRETGLDLLIDDCPWTMEQALDANFFPEK